MHLKILLSFLAVASTINSVGTHASETTDREEATVFSELPGQWDDAEYNGRAVFEEWPDEEIIYNHLDDNEVDSSLADEENSS